MGRRRDDSHVSLCPSSLVNRYSFYFCARDKEPDSSNKHLMTGPKGNSEFYFPKTSASPREWWNRELTLKCKFKCCVKPMKDLLGVSPSKGNLGTTRGKEKIILTLVGIEPTTSGLDLPLLCRLSYEVRQRKSGTI